MQQEKNACNMYTYFILFTANPSTGILNQVKTVITKKSFPSHMFRPKLIKHVILGGQ